MPDPEEKLPDPSNVPQAPSSTEPSHSLLILQSYLSKTNSRVDRINKSSPPSFPIPPAPLTTPADSYPQPATSTSHSAPSPTHPLSSPPSSARPLPLPHLPLTAIPPKNAPFFSSTPSRPSSQPPSHPSHPSSPKPAP
ncbi:MAG: hypothetical protein Q9207_007481, partial [Kuettlingeria erythrocarpa]